MENEEKYQKKEITRKKREDVYQKFKNLKISNKLNKKKFNFTIKRLRNN